MDYYTLVFSTVDGLEHNMREVRTDRTIQDLLSEQEAEEVGKHDMSRSGPGDLLDSSFMPADRVYHEIPGEGSVAITKAYPLQGYGAEVILMGFNQESEAYNKWKNTLGELGFEKKLSPKETMRRVLDFANNLNQQ